MVALRRLLIACLLLPAACAFPDNPPDRPHIFQKPPPPPTVRVATFNAMRLGHGAKKDAADPAMQAAAKLVTAFDVVAIQEVMTPEAAHQLAIACGPRWRAVVSPASVGRGSYREHYAVLYRGDKAIPIGEARTLPDPRDAFVREPFVASFRAGRFDFTLVVFHLDSPGNAGPLTREIRALEAAYRAVQDADPAEDDVILLGDFNRSTRSYEFDALRRHDGLRPLLDPAPRTTLNEEGPANAYDQVWVTKHSREFTGRWGVVDPVHAGVATDYRAARSTLSDHCPCWAEFHVDLDDDGPYATVTRP